MDLIGIGIGPSNLSLAALLHPLPHLSSLFLDKQKTFQWHRGLQLPFAEMQVSYLKDLVTLVDPKNPLSFLSFLSSQKRLYQFINANFQNVSRAEYNQYYRWACSKLKPKLSFDTEVKEVCMEAGKLLIKTKQLKLKTSQLVLGCGLSPYLPSFAVTKKGKTAFHSSIYKDNDNCYQNKKVVVIGGGQSSAEIILDLLSNPEQLPQQLTWVTRRDNYLPLDDSPFVNETFTPAYSNYFHSLPSSQRYKILEKQKLSSDGISHSTLEEIYRKLYRLRFINNRKKSLILAPRTEAFKLEKLAQGWELHTRNLDTLKEENIDADIIIFCTGYRYSLPEFLEPLAAYINKEKNGNLIINEDYSLQCELPLPSKIYIQNGARHCRGIADPNLSLSTWRSAVIINSITKRTIYNTGPYHSFFNWNTEKEKAINTYYPETQYA